MSLTCNSTITWHSIVACCIPVIPPPPSPPPPPPPPPSWFSSLGCSGILLSFVCPRILVLSSPSVTGAPPPWFSGDQLIPAVLWERPARWHPASCWRHSAHCNRFHYLNWIDVDFEVQLAPFSPGLKSSAISWWIIDYKIFLIRFWNIFLSFLVVVVIVVTIQTNEIFKCCRKNPLNEKATFVIDLWNL